MSSADIWADFDTIRHNVKHNTVERLKQIILSFNEQCGTSFTRAGKKQELIDRIARELDLWRRTNSADRWLKAKNILNSARSTTIYNPYVNGAYVPSATPTFATASIPPTQYQPRPPSAIPPYDPYAPPRRPAAPSTVAAASTSNTPGIQFKHSPFYRIERSVCNVTECPESTSQMDRRSQAVTFYLTNDILAKLESKSPRYQLRLYCTSSTYYSPPGSFRASSGPCPIEFPPTCEVRVNTKTLQGANLKGMKKKPGTAPPPDIGADLRKTNTALNRVEIVYVNSQNPAPSKKYYIVVMLVEVTSVDQLIDRLRKGKYKSSNEIIEKMNQAASEDDDIVAGHQKMSLKCPLSYMRIATPCRSAHCVHSQCFDAFSWYSMMEQTTTWLCPVCEKVLNTEDLIVDGYFDEILKETDEDVEDVIVEADGQWHTADNVHGSAAWKAAHPPVKDPPASLTPSPTKEHVKRRSPTPALVDGDASKSGPSNAEIVILDSDDEDEGQVKRELSPSASRSLKNSSASIGSLPPRSQTADSDVIDLTLDSDDEDTLVSAPPTKKRRSDERDITSPTEQIWKKSRTNSSPAAVPHSPPVSYVAGSSYSPPSRDSSRDPRTLPPPSPNRYNGAGYPPQPSAPPPVYAPPYIPPGAAPVAARPAVPTYPPSSYVAPANSPGSSASWRT